MGWRISMFSPGGMYGFVQNSDGEEVFFHAQDFLRLEAGGPPPLVGEEVDAEEIDERAGKRPQARRICRLINPSLRAGVVKSYDSEKGWGFVSFADSQAFLHASELMRGWLPVIGTAVEFYLGEKAGRFRACWVRPAGIANPTFGASG